MKRALITGITGQDGSYLAENLLNKGYKVYGVVRRTSTINRERLSDIYSDATKKHKNIELLYADLTDAGSMTSAIKIAQPDEIYNLAALSHVGISFDNPKYTLECDGMGFLNILEAVRHLDLEKTTKIYQASTSEMFGKVQEVPQTEKTPFYPRSPYGVAKLYAHWIGVNYKESYDMFITSGFLFNHESERRGENFVSKKITKSVAEIVRGERESFSLGNLDAKRDWGHAKDYVEAMYLMLQQDKPEDYVIATGETHSVREFVEKAFNYVNVDIEWFGKGFDEVGKDAKTGSILVDIDKTYFRPAEVDFLIGDATKAKNQLGWEPKIKLDDLVVLMMDYDLNNRT